MAVTNFSELISIFRRPAILLDENGVIVYWSKEYELLSGICEADAVGKQFKDFICTESEVKNCVDMISNFNIIYELKAKINEISGIFSYIPLQLENINYNAVLFNSDFESISGNFAFGFKERMIPLENMLSVVVHDINNAIGGITGALSLFGFKLSRGLNLDSDSISKYVSIMNESASKVTELVSLLNNFSSIPGQFQIKEELLVLLGRVFNSLQENQISIDTSDCKYDVSVKIDIPKIEEAIIKIIDNALYAINKKISFDSSFAGKIIISTRQVSNVQGEDIIAIDILDNGSGISSDIVDKIFDPFFTTKPKGDGRGVGLTIANYNVINNGGIIHINSEVDEWTKVSIYLPIV